MTIPQRHILNICERKVQYSKKQAEAKIKAARKRGKIITPTLNIYKCPFCWAHHIGHKKER